jgi:hypothetical protein
LVWDWSEDESEGEGEGEVGCEIPTVWLENRGCFTVMGRIGISASKYQSTETWGSSGSVGVLEIEIRKIGVFGPA